jgi:DNA replication protein DnaC
MSHNHQCSETWLCGTEGFGKSHLIATLVCYLTAKGDRTIYIPDCGACLKNPFRYIQAAMLFAWANNEEKQAEIVRIEKNNMEMIDDFFENVASRSHISH